MAVRVQFENNNEIGVFAKLTNAYCLVAIGGSENFYRYFLFGHVSSFSSVKSCIAPSLYLYLSLVYLSLNWLTPFQWFTLQWLVAESLAVWQLVSYNANSNYSILLQQVIYIFPLKANRHGILVPNSTTDQELQHIRNSLPDSVKIQRVEERLSALGNVIFFSIITFISLLKTFAFIGYCLQWLCSPCSSWSG